MSSPSALRKICCLFEGAFDICTIDIAPDCSVSDLQERIQEAWGSSILKGVDPHTLNLWKVDIDLTVHDQNSLSHLEVINIMKRGPAMIKILYPRDSIGKYWPYQLFEPRLQVIVTAQKPLRFEKPQTREQHTHFTYEEVNTQIEKEFTSLRAVVEAFIKNPEPPIWDPPKWATPSNREFLESLQLPSYRNGNPSLLFHDLHTCDGDQIKEIFGDARHMQIYNTSGSGKTRRLLEGLTKYWGFYIVAAVDATGVGVGDMNEALSEIWDYNQEWVSDLKLLSYEKRAAQSVINSRLASYRIKTVLAARIAVFRLFLEAVIHADGKLQEKHKRIWLLFQLSDHKNSAITHPFDQIRRCVRRASPEALDLLIDHLDIIRGEYLPPSSHFIVALDESQYASRLYPGPFVSSTDGEKLLSIICEIARVFTKLPAVKLVVSSTDLLLEDLEEATASGVSKPADAIRVFHELGMFGAWPQLKAFLDPYLPARFSETPSGYYLQHRMRNYLIPGRYRFSVSFLESLMMNGLESPQKLLNEYIRKLANCLPDNPSLPLTLGEPDLHIEVHMGGFSWNRLRSDSRALTEAKQIVQSHLLLKPSYGPVSTQLVKYGIARVCERSYRDGEIIEPLAFMSLKKWLETDYVPITIQ